MTSADIQTFKDELKYELCGSVFPFPLPDGFVSWFIDIGKLYENSYTTLPSDIIVTKSCAGNCFQNSQLVSLKNDGIPYIEGIMRGAKFKGIIHHGFNLFNEKVLDVTFLNNPKNFFDDSRDTSFYYFGVEICNNFFKDDLEILSSNYLNNHLIQNYYNYSLNKFNEDYKNV